MARGAKCVTASSANHGHTASKRRKNPKEKTIQRSILKWLSTTGLLHWRQNAGVLFVGPRRVTLGLAGLPDIILIVPPTGRFVGLEVKSKTGKMREAQIEFMQRLKGAGGGYHVVRSLDDAKNAVALELGRSLWKDKDGISNGNV